MHRSKRHLKTAAAVIIAVVAVIAAAFLFSPHHYLTIRSHQTGELCARYPMEEGDRFSIRFKHSVNLSNVTDVYEIEDGEIFVEETIYYHFGAGVQTQLNEGEVLSYGDDGSMIVSNIHQNRSNILYVVSSIYDHILTVNGQEISLREAYGPSAMLRFNYEFFWF